MRIAQVAPLHESVPPRLYGGTERVVSFLTEELVRQGHDVTLFASGDSRTSACLISCCDCALRLGANEHADRIAPHYLMFEEVFARASEFDIIHFHNEYLHFPWARWRPGATITTMHGRLDSPALAQLVHRFSDLPLVSISNAQRRPIPWANWAGTVYHGLPRGCYRFSPRSRGYLAYAGRIAPEKRPDLAIQIARQAGVPLRIAAKVDAADRAYFEHDIRPLLDAPGVEFLGEIDDAAKSEFYGGAIALLFPIDWPEPFGLVMIESMACGTPIIAFPNGSVPEIVEEGLTGMVVESVVEAVRAIPRAASMNRRACRARFEQRFSASRMAAEYLGLYEQCIDRAPRSTGGGVARAIPA